MIEGIGNKTLPLTTATGKGTQAAQTAKDDAFQAVLDQAVKKGEKEKLREACVDFESLMTNQMLKSMRNTIDRSDFFERGMDQDIFEGMLDETYSKEMAKSNQTGLADVLYRDLSKSLNSDKQQETPPSPGITKEK